MNHHNALMPMSGLLNTLTVKIKNVLVSFGVPEFRVFFVLNKNENNYALFILSRYL